MRFTLLCSLVVLLCTCVRAQCPSSLTIDSDEDVTNFRSSFPFCTSLPGNLTITGSAVTDVSGLSVLKGVNGNVLIEDLQMRGIAGLENITVITGDLTIANCTRLENNGFPEGLRLNTLGGFLSLSNLPSLTQFIPLDDLNILSSGFGSESISVSNYAPLSGLSGSMATLEITNNPNLDDLTALDGIALIDVMIISGNTSLSTCAIDPVCASLGAGNTATISGNAAACASVAQVTQQCFPPCTTPDHDALEAIYLATNGDDWTDNTNWLTDCDYCTWFGVTCDASDRVIGLDLTNNNLVGTLPSAVNELTKLRSLLLPANGLTGTVPELSALRNMQDLQLYGNGLSGSLPVLGSMPDLTLVHLINNDFSGEIPAAYNAANLPAIQSLFLSGNELNGELPAEIGGLTTLTRFHVQNNDLSGCYPPEYRDLCGITSIRFENNPGLPDGGSAGWFTEEFCFDGRVCEACDHPDYEGLMALYNGLDQFDNNPFITGWAEGAAGTDCEPCSWVGVTCDANGRVNSISLNGAGFTGVITPDIDLLTSLVTLELTGHNISGTLPASMAGMVQLEYVMLGSNNITGTSFPPLNLPNLRFLYLYDNELQAAPPIANCPQLTAYRLEHNPLNRDVGSLGISPSNLPALTRLSLNDAGLTGELPAVFGEWPAGLLTQLDLSGNNLEGCYPANYSSLCGNAPDFSDNVLLPEGGDPDFFADIFCGFGVNCELECHPDYQALAAIYFTTNGGDWTSSTNWMTDCDVCNWEGITCNADNRVSRINLSSNNLTGTLPAEIGELTELTGLILAQNEIGGSLPVSLASLENLVDLLIPQNEFAGSLPEGLFDNPNLSRVYLGSNEFTGTFPDLSGAPALRQVFMSNNLFNGPLPEFPSLPELFNFRIDGNDINGPLPLSFNPTNLPALELIGLGGCGLTGELPANVSGWTNLEEFYLNINNFTGCYPADYDYLCAADIAYSFTNNPNLPDGGSSDFFENSFCATGQSCEGPCHPDYDALVALYNSADGGGWTNDLGWADGAEGSDCNVCDWFGVSCDTDGRVIAVNMIGNNLSGTLPDELGDIDFLRGLNLSGHPNLTGPVPPSLFELGAITNVVLVDNDHTGGIPGNVGQAITLRVFQLDNSQNLGGDLPNGLTELVNLERLTLASCGLTGELPAAIDDLSSLNFMELSGNNLTGSLPASLGSVTGLTELYLQDNQLSGGLPPELANLTSLTDLLLNGNQLTGCYPDGYSVLCDIDRIQFSGNDGLPDGGSADFFENNFCATGQACGGDCPTDLVVTTNQDLVDFRAQYPNCTMLPGNLRLDGDITNTDQLNMLTSVGGNFEIYSLELNTIVGITGIVSVGGNFIVGGCLNLGANGFGNDLELVSIGENLILYDLPNVQTIAPLSNLTTVGRGVNIQRTGITSVDGLQSLSGTVNFLILSDNDELTDLTALGSSPGGRAATLTSIDTLNIRDNNVLTTLAGLEGFTVPGTLAIRNNMMLSDCATQTVCDKLAADDAMVTITNNGAGCSAIFQVEAACAPLPVSWQSFTATVTAKYVDLAWETLAEENNHYFVVERSADGADWTELGRVEAGDLYIFKDAAPLEGDNYYRLRQVDHEGAFSFSEVRRVNFARSLVDAWPNPFSGELSVFSAVPDIITVYDLNGRVLRILEHPGGGAQVQSMDLKQGVYLLRFQRNGEVLRIVAD